jgi:hypothetical protein
MNRPGRWISLLPILALVPRLGLSVLAADRQQVAPETRGLLLWWSSAALAVLVGLAEIYIGGDGGIPSPHQPCLPVGDDHGAPERSDRPPLAFGAPGGALLGDPRLSYPPRRLERRARPAFDFLRLRLSFATAKGCLKPTRPTCSIKSPKRKRSGAR